MDDTPHQGMTGTYAVCSAHPVVPATATCGRCGDFLCDPCHRQGESLCATCSGRVGGGAMPFDRSTFTISAALDHSIARFKVHGWELTGAGAVALIAPTIVQYGLMAVLAAVMAMAGMDDNALLFIGLSVSVYIPLFFVHTAVYLGGCQVALDSLEGRAPTFERYFSAMLKTWACLVHVPLLFCVVAVVCLPAGLMFVFKGEIPETLFTFGVTTAAVLGGAVLFWAVLGYLFAWTELVYDRAAGPLVAISRSFAIIRQQRLRVLALGFITFAASFAGLLLCCVGIIPATGFTYMATATFYLGLRRGLFEAPPRASGTW